MKPTPATLQAHEVITAAQQQAARIYPHSEYLQAEYMRALGVVRSTSGGWLLDKPITKGARNAQH